MDLVTLEKHFTDARRLARELLHRRYLARKAFVPLCVDQAIRQAQGQTISTFEKITLRTLSLEFKDWTALAVLQVAVVRNTRRNLIWVRAGVEASHRTSKRA